ncbi:L-rhamnose mutarotase [Aestuariimicrobium ganziense]|uniref:L-rhamnose mutarotase n=1 Tax=Aestuariimicrobium ganziense TaxID=2773677 RepID=UPI0019448DE6|nr:L-rhamnose mutarotase [Aestuariimicrobium ganziense]
MERVCFQLQVRADRLDEYVARHRAVWLEMLQAIEAAGYRNYSLFLRPDGLLIGYYETDSMADTQAAMLASEVSARWEAEMGEFFEGLDGGRPDTGFQRLDEVFNLDDQLSALPD